METKERLISKIELLRGGILAVLAMLLWCAVMNRWSASAWGTPVDEAHFVGPRNKTPILKAFGAHIFFDDQEKHVVGASSVVPAGLVPRRVRHRR